jgi:hypothetical protein
LPIKEGNSIEQLRRVLNVSTTPLYRIFLKVGLLTATKVPGKNTIVYTTMVFIEELSSLLATARDFESWAIPMFNLLSLWAMKL